MKKEYLNPSMEVILLNFQKSVLLSGGDPGKAGGNDGIIDDGDLD